MTTVEAPRKQIEEFFPTDEEYAGLLSRRTRIGWVVKMLFLLLLAVAVVGLSILLYTIIDDSFGNVAVVNQVEPEEVVALAGLDPSTTSFGDLDKDQLVTALQAGINRNVGRRLEREQRFYEDRLVFEPQDSWNELCASADATPGCTSSPRDAGNVALLIQEEIVQPDIIAIATLTQTVTDSGGFEEKVERDFIENPEKFPGYTFDQVRFEWRAWLSWSFLTTPNNATPEIAGVRTAILGSIWLVAFTILFAVPVGVGAAIYLEEFAKPTRVNELIQTNINNLAGVPSIIYGMLGLAVLVRTLEPFTQGRTVIAAGLTLGLLTLPVVIISSQEAIRAVPNSLRQAGMGLGATRWQTVRSQVLPVAVPGILTGAILAVARAIGETAPLILVGAASFITTSPTGPFSQFTALPIQIFDWTSRPQPEWEHLAAAASLTLLVLLLVLNGAAVILRNKYSRRIS